MILFHSKVFTLINAWTSRWQDLQTDTHSLGSILLNPFGWNSYEAVLWRYVESTSTVLLLNNTANLFPYYAFGFVFIFQVYRFYQKKASRIWTVIAGIYATIHPLLLSLPVILGLPFTIASGGEFMYPAIIPIPLLLLFGLVAIHLRPPTPSS